MQLRTWTGLAAAADLVEHGRLQVADHSPERVDRVGREALR